MIIDARIYTINTMYICEYTYISSQKNENYTLRDNFYGKIQIFFLIIASLPESKTLSCSVPT